MEVSQFVSCLFGDGYGASIIFALESEFEEIVQFVDAGDEDEEDDGGQNEDRHEVDVPGFEESPSCDAEEGGEFVNCAGDDNFTFDFIRFEVVVVLEAFEEGFDSDRESDSGNQEGGSAKEEGHGLSFGGEGNIWSKEEGEESENDSAEEEPNNGESEGAALLDVG